MVDEDKQKETIFEGNHEMLKQFWSSRILPGGVTKLETGILGFDELLEGGVPKGRTTLISGGTGCGKTVFLSEFLFRGISKYNQPGVFVTFEERPKEILRNLRNFGWNLDQYHEAGKIDIVDGSPPEIKEAKLGSVEWLEPAIARIKYAIEKTGAYRLVVDNLGTVFDRYGVGDGERAIREQLFYFADAIKNMGITTLISTERFENRSILSRYGVEAFVSDGLIELDFHSGENTEIRTVRVCKLRGVGYRSGKVIFQITNSGLAIFPKVPIDPKIADTDFNKREEIGLPSLDQALGGGIPKGQVMLIAGNTGTGKTTLAQHFISKGLMQGTPGVWVALEESKNQVLKAAASYSIDLKQHETSGKLEFIHSSLLDIVPDKLLYQIFNAVLVNGSKRIVIDSISSMESALMNKDKVREFLLQLAGFSKANGITVALTYLTGEAFGAGHDQLLGALATNAMRLSSIVDGIILLRYVERNQCVQKLLNILKLRGSEHKKDIFQYDIGQSGFTLGDRFASK